MSFFYHNDDPLLSRYNNTPITNHLDTPNNVSDTYSQIYRQQLLQDFQQQQTVNNEMSKDWIGDLDERLKKLKTDIINQLNSDDEFNKLNATVQSEIQREIMSLVKFKLNANPTVRDSIKRQMEIIDKISEASDEEDRKNMMELNDYMKNYSHLTFDEYRKIKKGKIEAAAEPLSEKQ